MKFGPLAVEEAAGTISAHSVKRDGLVIRKGAVISEADAVALRGNGVERVVAAVLEPGDIGEDEAALRLGRVCAGPSIRVEQPFTGRCNLFAARAGIFVPNVAAIDRLNGVDEAITLATLTAFRPVIAHEMIATVKIIPYAVAGATLDQAAAIAEASCPLLDVSAYRLAKVGTVSTLLPGLKPSVVTKTVATLRVRLAPASAEVVADATCPHEPHALAAAIRRQLDAGCELIVVFGASAIADRRDVIPTAIEAAGGQVECFGMPVDPGNLLLLGRIGHVQVVGAPGCARSPKENGFDWVLQRLLADIPVTRADVAALGVGGLLMEIVSRGQPREGGEPADE